MDSIPDLATIDTFNNDTFNNDKSILFMLSTYGGIKDIIDKDNFLQQCLVAAQNIASLSTGKQRILIGFDGDTTYKNPPVTFLTLYILDHLISSGFTDKITLLVAQCDGYIGDNIPEVLDESLTSMSKDYCYKFKSNFSENLLKIKTILLTYITETQNSLEKTEQLVSKFQCFQFKVPKGAADINPQTTTDEDNPGKCYGGYYLNPSENPDNYKWVGSTAVWDRFLQLHSNMSNNTYYVPIWNLSINPGRVYNDKTITFMIQQGCQSEEIIKQIEEANPNGNNFKNVQLLSKELPSIPSGLKSQLKRPLGLTYGQLKKKRDNKNGVDNSVFYLDSSNKVVMYNYGEAEVRPIGTPAVGGGSRGSSRKNGLAQIISSIKSGRHQKKTKSQQRSRRTGRQSFKRFK